MKPARLLRILRLLLPGLVTFVAVLLTVLPLGIPFAAVVTPFLSLMAVYYWSIYRPDLLPPAAVFVLGVLQDILTGGPVGLLALVLLLVQALAVSQRRILLGQAFSVEWAGLLLI
ncbi:MAG: rod shape-determining protein MreD, partial [Alphaproteobacteria bacterium]|nr:rod shape-determining protein MreD [Alphaproteobacteria bacterium]